MQLLAQNRGLDRRTLGERIVDEEQHLISWSFGQQTLELSGRITTSHGVVSTTEISVEGAFTFGDAVGKFGEPEEVSVVVGMADSQWLLAVLLYPSQGVLVDHFNPNLRRWQWPQGASLDLAPSMAVRRVIFFDPALYEELLRTRRLIRQEHNDIVKSLQPWDGFDGVPYLDIRDG